jgi:hypothetical protein
MRVLSGVEEGRKKWDVVGMEAAKGSFAACFIFDVFFEPGQSGHNDLKREIETAFLSRVWTRGGSLTFRLCMQAILYPLKHKTTLFKGRLHG